MKAPKLTIKQKLLLSYLSMALLTVVASAYAIISLKNLNKLAFDITNRDYIILENSKYLLDTLLVQESTEKKFLIFKDPSFADIFRARSRDFKNYLATIKQNRFPGLDPMVDKLSTLQDEYGALFQKELALIKENRPDEATLLSDNEGKSLIDDMANRVRALGKKADKDIDANVRLFKDQSNRASRITFALSVISLIAGVSLAILITYNIARPLRKLERTTALIAEGKFENDLNMNRQDAIGSLARAFTVMAERLKVLEAYHRDASPLTGLPGNLAIEKHIEDKLAENCIFSLCHLDLDNFKPFADHYGYAWGSEVIKDLGYTITQEVKRLGFHDAFIGHIGGDDFVVIAHPEQAEKICQSVIQEFDQSSLKFYSQEDRQKGYFSGVDRSGQKRDFPLVTLTVAIVTGNGSRFRNPLEMAALAAKLKEYAKSLPGSNYVRSEDVEKIYL